MTPADKREFRRDLLTGRWVVIAPKRRDRPLDGTGEKREKRYSDPVDCPFCPGNETLLPEVIYENKIERTGRWQTRIVPNKYPILNPRAKPEAESRGIYEKMSARGYHEVIVETPIHGRDMSLMSVAEAEAVIDTFHRRYSALKARQDVRSVALFHNHGIKAGATLEHPHSQIAAMPFVPLHVKHRENRALEYHSDTDKCVKCGTVEYESRVGERLVRENDRFIAFVPYASCVPYEIHIVPLTHRSDFADLKENEKESLARILRDVLRSLESKLDGPDYNYAFSGFPHHAEKKAHLHWSLVILPKLTVWGGFELESHVPVNPSSPEENARHLRE